MNVHTSTMTTTCMDVSFLPAMRPNAICVHLGPVGMFMTPQEARELATKLLNAAVQADAFVAVPA